MTPSVITAGGAIIDCIVAAERTLALGAIGGNAVHAAVGASLMGASVGIVARVPEGWPVAEVAAAGIGTEGMRVEKVPAPEPEWFFHRHDGTRIDRLHATVAEAAAFGVAGERVTPALAAAWERHLAGRAATGGYAAFRAAHPLGPEHVPPAWWAAAALHLGPGPPASLLALARAARARGLRVTLDPGFAARGLAPDLLEALLAAADVFLPSEAELAALRPGLAPAAALATLVRAGGPLLVAKLGARGAVLIDPADGVPQHLPALPVDALDPTGAGDAFAGGLVAGLVGGEAPPCALRRALVAGAVAVEAMGALAPLALPPAEVAARLDRLDRLIAGSGA